MLKRWRVGTNHEIIQCCSSTGRRESKDKQQFVLCQRIAAHLELETLVGVTTFCCRTAKSP